MGETLDRTSRLEELLPDEVQGSGDLDTLIPRIAKDRVVTGAIRNALKYVPTNHQILQGDARGIELPDASVDLVVTSPPYWTLKQYEDVQGQLGHLQDYDRFLDQLDHVWHRCFDALVPGGRLICVVGDVCLSRRKNKGRHTVVPLHASIQDHCRRVGFDNLAPIIWHKIANANYEVAGGGGFLGKPYEPNAVIKNDIEFILMERKPGGYRRPTRAARLFSVLSEEEHRAWFQQIWTGITGESTRNHPAPYPVSLVDRLIRMFSFVGDTVLDPFAGTGTTALAASRCGRNSISVELVPQYVEQMRRRLAKESNRLFGHLEVHTRNIGAAA